MAQITVDSVAALTGALKTVQSGDTILLQPGSYSGASLSGLSFPGGVTIASADPAHQAVLSNFNVVGSQGLTFANLEFQATAPANFAFQVSRSSDIHFDHISMHGSLNGDTTDDPSGLQIMSSANVTVSNSEFQQLARAVAVSTSSGVTLSDNHIHDIRSDGFDFAQVDHLKVTGNVLSDFHPIDGDHPDAMQFWTNGTTAASHDIEIVGNLVLRGDGATVQGIFMTDASGVLPAQRVTIADNVIVGTGYNAIRISGAQDLTLHNNELVTYAGDYKTFMLIQNSDGVTATDNKAVSMSFDGSTNVVQSGNLITDPVTDGGDAATSAWYALHTVDLTQVDTTVTTPDPILVTTDPAPVIISDTPEPAPVLETTLDVTRDNPDVLGNAADNIITGDYRINVLQGMDGNDTLSGVGNEDILIGGAGDDVYILPNSLATIVEEPGGGIDTLVGRGIYVLPDNVENLVISTTAKNNWSGTGNELDNQITGNDGNNYLQGLVGADTLSGGDGKDTLVGGDGADRLTGGAGADIFRFTPGGGRDVVTDLGSDDGRDLVDIWAYLKAGLRPELHDVGSDVVISFSNGDTITLLGVHASDLGNSHYGWVL